MKIGICNIFKQIYSDLIGKDSYRGITLSYAYLANQTGHFALGFIPSYVIYQALILYKYPLPATTVATIVGGGWFVFELFNFLGPLLLAKQSKASRIYIAGDEYVFEPQWFNVGFDTFIDVCFFVLGSFAFAISLEKNLVTETVLIVSLGISLLGFVYWYPIKIFMQNARYPFQFRLSQWNGIIENSHKESVQSFLMGKCKNLLIFGAEGSGKSSLGVGIATELSIKRNRCSYTTVMKMINIMNSEVISDDNNLWNLQEAEIIVVDDLNPGFPIMDDIITPDEFRKMILNKEHLQERNKSILCEKQIIWILGNQFYKDPAGDKWQKILEHLNDRKPQIEVINLSGYK